MNALHALNQSHRPSKRRKRVGRGPGSKRGKTCGRGHKGDKSRRGYKRRYGQEGGQMPLYRIMPTRGFSRGRFVKECFAVNLSWIERFYHDGETVSLETLRTKGLASRSLPGGLKILGAGELKRKVTIEAKRFSKTAVEKLKQSGVSFHFV
jgi:large subunit ribosomal protein L15